MLHHMELALWSSLGEKKKKEGIKHKSACLLKELGFVFGFPHVISEV